MITLTSKIVSMQQKYQCVEGEPAKVFVTIKMEVKDGIENLPKIAEVLNYPVNITLQPVTASLL